jgi:hypothetical protein
MVAFEAKAEVLPRQQPNSLTAQYEIMGMRVIPQPLHQFIASWNR